jgi:uncharacterized protein YecT (DUF1311 family)
MAHAMCAHLLYGFGALAKAMEARDHREDIILSIAHNCTVRLGNTLGEPWMGCVVSELDDVRDRAKLSGSRHRPGQLLERLRPGGKEDASSDFLKNVMRNYSCEVADGGSQPLRSFQWSYHRSNPCGQNSDRMEEMLNFTYFAGFLPAGNDIRSGFMTKTEALDACDADATCAGVTYQAQDMELSTPDSKLYITLKSSAEGRTKALDWHTWRKLRELDCSTEAQQRRLEPMVLTVHVLQARMTITQSPHVWPRTRDGSCAHPHHGSLLPV